MGIVRAVACGTLVGGAFGLGGGMIAADIFREVVPDNTETAVGTAFASKLETSGSEAMQTIIFIGSAAMGAVAAASTSLNLRYSQEEIAKTDNYLSE